MIVPLLDAHDESRFGGKAIQLGSAIRAGLPVPSGFAIDHNAARSFVHDGVSHWAELRAALAACAGPVAVRSSAIGEDSHGASFAGQHATVLGVRSEEALARAVREVWASAHDDAATNYRKKLGLDPDPKMGIVVQRLVDADVAGVLFTRHPVTGADERVIEAAWGLGEVVVQGLVTPDNFRVARGGHVLSRTVGEKDVMIRPGVNGSEECAVDPVRANTCCLDMTMVLALDALATQCETLFQGAHDIEFAFERGALFLLQRRAITRG